MNNSDRTIVRDLAREIADIAAQPAMDKRVELWKQHNSLASQRPLILVFPEGSWCEIIRDEDLCCENLQARQLERGFRQCLHQYRHFADDTIVTAEMTIQKIIRNSGWGLEAQWQHSSQQRGAKTFHPVLNDYEDIKKLRFPEHEYDEAATTQRLALMQDLVGDIISVQTGGIKRIGYHLMKQYTELRGLSEAMMDMAADPEMVHEVMAFFTEGHKRALRDLEAMNALDFNNDNSYQNSGGNGWTDELPAADADPACARPMDMWSSAEDQELAQVSPEMHEEFAFRYVRELLAPFGLNGYGCCEDLTDKLDSVFSIPHIRRISISPWADVERCADKLKGNYIFSWKPHPAHLVGVFNPQTIRASIRKTLDAAKAHGCVLEIILKDTHTCDHHPERFDEWTRVAREEIEKDLRGVPVTAELI